MTLNILSRLKVHVQNLYSVFHRMFVMPWRMKWTRRRFTISDIFLMICFFEIPFGNLGKLRMLRDTEILSIKQQDCFVVMKKTMTDIASPVGLMCSDGFTEIIIIFCGFVCFNGNTNYYKKRYNVIIVHVTFSNCYTCPEF